MTGVALAIRAEGHRLPVSPGRENRPRNTPRKAPLAFFVACVVFAFAIAATRAVLAQPPLPPARGDPAAPAGTAVHRDIFEGLT